MTSPSVPVESREQPTRHNWHAYKDPHNCPTCDSDKDATIRELQAEVEQLTPPCDAGCRDYAEEECSRHGRKVAEVWDALGVVQQQRDQALAERDRARDLAAHLEAELAQLAAFQTMFTRSVVGGPSYLDLLRHSTDPGAVELRAEPDVAYLLAAHLEAEQAEEGE